MLVFLQIACRQPGTQDTLPTKTFQAFTILALAIHAYSLRECGNTFEQQRSLLFLRFFISV